MPAENRLRDASSPYLRQHAENPVHWQEWGTAPFDEARERDVPVFLSIGYSSCHWCHVMAHESFEDADVAQVLNDGFVPVKVDREERPDVDRIYMDAVQAMTQHGGWPLSVFLTPDGVPFFGGTYWPKEDRGGSPGFLRVLDAVRAAWRDDRGRVAEAGQRLVAHLREQHGALAGGGAFDADLPSRAAARAVAAWDDRLGGFGSAPKFPQAMLLDFLLAHAARTGDASAERAALHTLRAMARGGIRDHVAGGFHRYSVDARWLVPHFEKMLYDNALLLRAYVHAWQATGDEELATVARDTADYLLADLQQPEGGFSAATDADTDGVEGLTFAWTLEELEEVVASVGEDPGAWSLHLGATAEGNWHDPHGHAPPRANVLSLAGPRPGGDDGYADRWARVRGALRARRDARPQPGLDDKVLLDWNALAIEALAEAGAALGERRHLDAAQRCATFVRERMTVGAATGSGLAHTWTARHGAKIPAFAEDLAGYARALLVLYEAAPDPALVHEARAVAADVEARFADGEGGYWSTAEDDEALLVRAQERWDNATPSAASTMAEVHLRLGALVGEPEAFARAERILGRAAPGMERAPTGFGEALRAAERLVAGPVEVALVGPDPSDLLAAYRERWRPGAVLAVATGAPGEEEDVPLLRDRPAVDGRAAAYVCRRFACDRPVVEPDDLRALLERG